MRSIDFQEAQQKLTYHLNKKLLGERHDERMETRANRLVDLWFKNANRPKILLGSAGIEVTGCTLVFAPGSVRIKSWATRFIIDRHNVHVLSPRAVALGYVNDYQLFLTTTDEPKLIARRGHEVLSWTSGDGLIPPQTSPLFIALERAKTLGYLYLMRG